MQTTRPLTPADRTELAALHVEILEYVPQDTYICKYVPADLGPIRTLPFVAWVNTYMREFKIAPSLRPATAASALAFAPNPPLLSKEPVTVEVVLQKNAMSDAVRDAIAQAVGVTAASLQAGGGKVRLTVPEGRLAAIVAIDAVRHIEKHFTPRLSNNVARGILAVDPVQAAGTSRGEGQIFCVCDTGFDNGATANVHPAFTGRVVKLCALGATLRTIRMATAPMSAALYLATASPWMALSSAARRPPLIW